MTACKLICADLQVSNDKKRKKQSKETKEKKRESEEYTNILLYEKDSIKNFKKIKEYHEK